jgi:hypothetical protein
MARKPRTAEARRKSKAVESETAQAANGALGFAMQVLDEDDPASAVGRINALAELCDQAADHMALAHNLLVTHENHTDTAIEHLDAALGCLKQLMTEGEERIAAKQAKEASPAPAAKSA